MSPNQEKALANDVPGSRAEGRQAAAQMVRQYRKTGNLSAIQRLTALDAKLTKATNFARGDMLARDPLAKRLLIAATRSHPGVGPTLVDTLKNRASPLRDHLASTLKQLKRTNTAVT